MGAELRPATVGRLAACLFVASGTLTVVTLPLPRPPGMNAPATFLVAVTAIVIGMAAYVAPWDRWPRRASLVLLPFAFALIASGNAFGSTRPYSYSIFFIVAFAWVGLAHPRWTSIPLAAPATAAYVIPMFVRAGTERTDALGALFAIPVCILVAEVIAWTVARERRSRRSAAALARVALELGQHLDEDRLAQTLVEQARHALGCEHAVLLRLDPTSMRVLRVHASGVPASIRDVIDRRLGTKVEPLPAQLLRGDPMVVADVDDDPNLADLITHFRVKSFLSVPVLALDQLVAVLSCWETSRRRDYDAEDIALGRALAGQASAAIENARLYMRTREASRRDPLTGLPNRRAFAERLDAEMDRSLRHGRALSLALLDCDRFKRVNDSLGHQTGDRVLERVAEMLQRNRRTEDEVFRLGGDEFAALLPETGAAGAAVIGERLRRSIRRAALGPEGVIDPLTVSVGVASLGVNAFTATELFHEADAAMYDAKRTGGDACVLPSTITEGALTLGVDVGWVIANELVRAVYQPVFDVGRGNVIAFEALIRLDPTLGHTPTRTLFRAAGTVGKVELLDDVCRRVALRGAAADLPRGTSLFVNVSPAGMTDPSVFATRITSAAGEVGLEPHRLIIEVTDDDRSSMYIGVLRCLRSCQQAGFRIAMDDFAGRPCDIDLLSAIDFDYVKVDISAGLGTNVSERRRAVLKGFAGIISETGARPMAAGLENIEDLRLVRELGLFAAQGMFLRPPEALLNTEPRPLRVEATDPALA